MRATLSLPAGRTMHSIGPHTSNWTSISQTLAAAYVNGVEIDWLALHKPYENNLELLTLPAYSWDMKDYWLSWSERGSDDAVSEKPQALATPQPFIATCAQYLVHKSMSPKIEVTLSASLSDPGFLALINGHKMQKIALASGSVFCDAAATAAMYAIEYSGRKDVTADSLTLHDPELLAPLTNSLVGIDGALITTAIMDSSSSNTISVSFKATSAHVSHVLGSIRVEISDPQKTQADWDRISYFVKATMDERIKLSKEGLSHRMQPEIIYALFANAVEFDPAFKGIQEAYIANDFHEAAAVVVLPSNPPGTRFTFSPYWGEALVHLAGFMVNGNPGGSPDTTFIVMGFGSSQQTVNFESGKNYLVYTRISRWEKETAYCDAFVFDPVSSKMIMQCIDLRYTELPRVSWRHILEGAHASSGDSDRAKRIKKVVVEQIVRSDTIERSEPSSPASDKILATNTKLFDIILNSISKSTGSDPSEFTNDTVIAELGVDSIMSIEIVAAVNAESDVELPASFIFDYPTIADLHRAFGGQKQSTKVLEAESSLTTYDATASSSDCPTPDFASVPGSISSSNSNSSFSHIEQAEATAPENEENNALQELQFNSHDSDTSPQPSVRITLLQGRPGSGQTPIYMMADGTGSIASYIHLPAFRSRMPVYGIDSPFLRCPSRLTSQVGIPGVAKLIVAALVKALTKGQFYIGGFSAGCMVAFEVCRQLGATGRKADGLVLIDLCCPRPTALDETAIREESKTGVAVFGAAVAKDGMWSSAATTEEHLSAYFVAMRLYNPPPIAIKEQPRGTAVIWAEKGMVNHVVDNPKIMKMLADGGIPTKAYPKYMEDPKLSPMACLIPDKTKADLGPNGWDRYTGNVLALSVDADHLDLPMPRHVHLLHAQLIKAFSHFEDLR